MASGAISLVFLLPPSVHSIPSSQREVLKRVKGTMLILGPCLKCHSGFRCTQRKSTLPAKIWKALLSSEASSPPYHYALVAPAYFLWLQHSAFLSQGLCMRCFPCLKCSFPISPNSALTLAEPATSPPPLLNVLIAP